MVKQVLKCKRVTNRIKILKKNQDIGVDGGRVLTFGQKTKPKQIVVMFHGNGDDVYGCSGGWADVWAAGLKNTLVIVPESPDICQRDIGSDKENPGHDWLRQRGIHDTNDEEASIKELQRVTRKRLRSVNTWLDWLLKKHNLSNADLVLTGFSQGTVLAALVGANRGVKAVVLCGGVGTEPVHSVNATRGDRYVGREVWARWEELMPKVAPNTKFFALEGTSDCTVPRKKKEHLMKPFDCTFRWEKDLLHYQLFYKRFRNVMLKWMQEVQ